MKVVALETPSHENAKRPRLWYLFVANLARILSLALFRFKSQGAEHLPRSGACLIASNHVSFLDPPLVGAALRHREIHFFARKSLFKVWWLGRLIRSLNSIPVDLGNVDFAGTREALRLLKSGEALLVFPE